MMMRMSKRLPKASNAILFWIQCWTGARLAGAWMTPHHHLITTNTARHSSTTLWSKATKTTSTNRHHHHWLFPYSTITTAPLFSANTNDNESTGNASETTTAPTPTKNPAKPLPEILRFRGSVDQGYGRGGKKLGVPTANLPASLFQNALESVQTGVYFGWTALEREDSNDAVYKAVVNVGYSPTFEGQENPEKIIEAHLILDNDDDDDDDDDNGLADFYGVPMKLQLVGFLRREQKFDIFPDLIAQIHADIQNAKNSLDTSPYKEFQTDSFLSPSSGWVGSSGGDGTASWEFVSMNSSNDDSGGQDIIEFQKAASASADDATPATTSSPDADKFLQHQQKVFDEISSWFGNRDKEVTPELEPVYHKMAGDILTQIVNNKSSDNENDDDGIVKVLDVACGTGVLWEFLLQQERQHKLQITGVDLSSEMINLAQDKIKLLQDQYGNKDGDEANSVDIAALQSDILSYCQEDETSAFDGAIVNACFGNFFDPRQVLEALCSVGSTSSGSGKTICVSHPLGAAFVQKLHQESPETVPHVLPETLLEATKWTHGLPCVTSSLKTSSSSNDNDYYLWTLKTCRAKGLPEILRFRGVVDQGYGRGGKKLGVPTANLPASLFQNALEELSTGVYFGWATLEREDGVEEAQDPFKAVVNIGYSPTFEGKENPEKIIEAHLILEDGDSSSLADFYGVPMKLQLVGFLRNEQKFDSFPDLIAQIHADILDAKNSLEEIPYKQLKTDDFFASSSIWVGSSGGDETASWEFVSMMDVLPNVLSSSDDNCNDNDQ